MTSRPEDFQVGVFAPRRHGEPRRELGAEGRAAARAKFEGLLTPEEVDALLGTAEIHVRLEEPLGPSRNAATRAWLGPYGRGVTSAHRIATAFRGRADSRRPDGDPDGGDPKYRAGRGANLLDKQLNDKRAELARRGLELADERENKRFAAVADVMLQDNGRLAGTLGPWESVIFGECSVPM